MIATQTAAGRATDYGSLTELSSVGLFRVDSSGSCCYVSRQWRRLTGLTLKEAKRGSWGQALHPEDRQRVRNEWSVAFQARSTFHSEYRFRAADGVVIWVLAQAVPDIDSEGEFRGYVGTLTDISRQKKAEDELRRSEQRYLALAECAGVGITQLSLDGTTLYLNPAMREMLELEPGEDVTQLRYEQFFSPESCLLIRSGLISRSTGVRSSYEARLVGRRGTPRVVVISGAPVLGTGGRVEGAIGTVVDVTARRKAEDALEQSRDDLELRVSRRTAELERANRSLAQQVAERQKAEASLMQKASELEAVFRAFPDLYFRLSRDGRILGYYAGRAYDLYAPPEAFLGKPISEVLPEGPARQFESALRQLADTESLISIEYLLPMREGPRWFEARMVPLLDDQVAVVVREISERHRAEQALRESECHHRETAEYNKRLVLEVDHRVRNNLAGLLSVVALTRANARGVDAFADAIEGRLRAMSHVHDVLAANGSGRVELGELTRSLLDALKALSRHRATLRVDGAPVILNSAQTLPLMMVVQEWFTNSCKYGALSVPDGTLRIGWDVDDAAGAVRFRWTESGGPPICAPVRPSLGTELVNSFVTRELRGEFRPGYPSTGADHLLVFRAAA